MPVVVGVGWGGGVESDLSADLSPVTFRMHDVHLLRCHQGILQPGLRALSVVAITSCDRMLDIARMTARLAGRNCALWC